MQALCLRWRRPSPAYRAPSTSWSFASRTARCGLARFTVSCPAASSAAQSFLACAASGDASGGGDARMSRCPPALALPPHHLSLCAFPAPLGLSFPVSLACRRPVTHLPPHLPSPTPAPTSVDVVRFGKHQGFVRRERVVSISVNGATVRARAYPLCRSPRSPSASRLLSGPFPSPARSVSSPSE